MNKRSLVTLASAALVAAVSAASAASGAGTSSSENEHGLQPSDRLDLSQGQQQTAWNDLYMGSLNQKTPSGFNAVAGASMPPNGGNGASHAQSRQRYSGAQALHIRDGSKEARDR